MPPPGPAARRGPLAALPRGAWLAAAATVLVAGMLRLWHVSSGLPYAVAVDEPEIMARVVRMMKTGDFDPHFFDWPSLTIYLQLVVSCVVFLAGAVHGLWRDLNAVGASDFYIYGRTTTALLGAATVAVLFCAARRWGTAAALVAAALLACFPQHVRESHFVLADVPAAFFVALTLLLTLRADEQPSTASFAAAGLAAGLAASAKYNGVIAMVMPLTAAIAAGGSVPVVVGRLLTVAGSAAAGFLVGTPYAVLDLPKFLSDFARLAGIFARPRAGEPGWSLYLKYVRQTAGWIGIALAAAGLAVSVARAMRGPDRARSLYLVVFPACYFYVMARSFQIYGRYTLPILPFVALLAAVGAMALWTLVSGRVTSRARAFAAAGAVAVLCADPFVQSVRFDLAMGRQTTIDAAFHWIDEHAPAGASIVSETHPLLLTSTRFRITNVPPLSGRAYADYVAGGVDYVLVSSYGYRETMKAPEHDPRATAAYRSIFAQGKEVASFTPSDEVAGPELRLFSLHP